MTSKLRYFDIILTFCSTWVVLRLYHTLVSHEYSISTKRVLEGVLVGVLEKVLEKVLEGVLDEVLGRSTNEVSMVEFSSTLSTYVSSTFTNTFSSIKTSTTFS